MKQFLFLPFLLCAFFAHSQATHFTVNLQLRFESETLYCDVVTQEDYPITSLQFGFHHNSDDVEFLGLNSSSLPNVENLKHNEVCPKFVRLLWYNVATISFPKGTVLLTLAYKIKKPTNHFICMMPSSNRPDLCDKFLREVYNKETNEAYAVDDACVNYTMNGNLVILKSIDPVSPFTKAFFTQSDMALHLSADNYIIQNTTLRVQDMQGKVITQQALEQTAEQTIPLECLTSGLYIFTIQDGNKILYNDKFIVH